MAHIINGYDLGTYGDLDVCTEVFAVHDGEFPAEQPRQDSEAYARAFLLKLLSRPCTPLEGSPDESIAFADDETGLGFVVAYETGEESSYGTVEVSNVRIYRDKRWDRDDEHGDEGRRDNDTADADAQALAEWRNEVVGRLEAINVLAIDGDSHARLSAICDAVFQTAGSGWTVGTCEALRLELIGLIRGFLRGDETPVSAESVENQREVPKEDGWLPESDNALKVAYLGLEGSVKKLRLENERLERKLERRQRRIDALREEAAELNHKLEHRQWLAERNGAEARDLTRENKSLRRQIKAYKDTVRGLMELVRLVQGK